MATAADSFQNPVSGTNRWCHRDYIHVSMISITYISWDMKVQCRNKKKIKLDWCFGYTKETKYHTSSTGFTYMGWPKVKIAVYWIARSFFWIDNCHNHNLNQRMETWCNSFGLSLKKSFCKMAKVQPEWEPLLQSWSELEWAHIYCACILQGLSNNTTYCQTLCIKMYIHSVYTVWPLLHLLAINACAKMLKKAVNYLISLKHPSNVKKQTERLVK